MLEIDESFTSLSDWLAYATNNPAVYSSAAADEVAGRVLAIGVVEPLTGRPRKKLQAPDRNWREGLTAAGIGSRHRAVLKLIEEAVGSRWRADVAIYATEAVTPFADILRASFPQFTGSEYAPEGDPQGRFVHQDLMGLTFAPTSFDIVTTNDVLEHVPDIDAALREIARVLKPGGRHIGTHPFFFMSAEGDLRARVVDGQVVHLRPPEYHINPVDIAGGSLVFETPGWDIIERAKAAGFEHAEMRFVASERHGCLTENLGVFVLCLQKAGSAFSEDGAGMTSANARFASRGQWLNYLRANPGFSASTDPDDRAKAVVEISSMLDGEVIALAEDDLHLLPEKAGAARKGDWIVCAPKFRPGTADGALPTGPGISWNVLNACRVAGLREPEMRLVRGVFVLCAEK
jgi:SAM-dependent methyltransferase